MHKFNVLGYIFIVIGSPGAFAQEAPSQGVVWNVPTGDARARSDLREMAGAGVNAVRTDLVFDGALLAYAGELGIDVYLDLPISLLPTTALLDTLEYATALVDSLLDLARNHAALRGIGLARHIDTSDPAACLYFERIAAHVRARAADTLRLYYTTRFIDDDRCANTVDMVLVDARDHDNPAKIARRWRAAGENRPPIGIGALGVWVRGDSLVGLNVSSSPQRQARYFEWHLPAFLSDTLSAALPVVFVYRWRDYRQVRPSTALDLIQPYVQRYGLHELDGTPRPALDVVAGIYTNRQTVFAFKQGRSESTGDPWVILVGWGALVMLAVFFALSPRLRHMVPRYFQARFFFRESVREGRDVLFGATTALLGAIGIASGLVTLVVLDAVRRTDTFETLVRWLPEALRGMIVTLLAQPWIMFVLAGCTYVFTLLLWTIVLSLCSRWRYPVAPAQALMLVVWPRWPLLLVMIAAMVLASASAIQPWVYVLAVGVWLLIEAGAVVRTIFDLVGITGIPSYLALPCLLLYPGTPALGALAIVLLSNMPEVTFLWHSLTRS